MSGRILQRTRQSHILTILCYIYPLICHLQLSDRLACDVWNISSSSGSSARFLSSFQCILPKDEKTPLSLFTFTPLSLSSQSIVPKYKEKTPLAFFSGEHERHRQPPLWPARGRPGLRFAPQTKVIKESSDRGLWEKTKSCKIRLRNWFLKIFMT